jgi:hypothetical protein
MPLSNNICRSGIRLQEFVLVSNTRLGVATCVCSLILMLAANPVVRIIAPGLSLQHHAAAVVMLRLMSPVLILSGAAELLPVLPSSRVARPCPPSFRAFGGAEAEAPLG